MLRGAGVAFTSLRNGWYIENYTDQLGQYLATGEILGAARDGEISAATRQDYAVAAVTALVGDDGGDRIYELGGPSFTLTQLAETIAKVTGTPVIYRDLPVQDYAAALQRFGLDLRCSYLAAMVLALVGGG